MISITLHCGQYRASGEYVPNRGFLDSVRWTKNDYGFDRLLMPEVTAELLIMELRKLTTYFDANMDVNSNFTYERRLTGLESSVA